MTPETKHPVPLSLYIHIPWCVRKCPYCDFNSHAVRDIIPEKKYCQALLDDLGQDLSWIGGRRIESIFIGGGTPGLFSAEALDGLLDGVRRQVVLEDNVEITLEVNPGTAEYRKFADFFSLGINRLSIGVQSFNDRLLDKIGRIHDRKAAIKAAEAAHYAGFTNFNLDLMFGLPGQTTKEALSDLQTATSLEPAHLSWYQLTIEPNTFFYQNPPRLPADDAIWETQIQGQRFLQTKQVAQYEVSAYSRKRPCLHNLNYWRFGDYLGIGAGAHAKLSRPDLTEIIRLQKPGSPQDYMQQAEAGTPLSKKTRLDPADRILEFMMNALRLNKGVSRKIFISRTGVNIDSIEPWLEKGVRKGLLIESDQRIQASEQGIRYLNDLLEIFMDEKLGTRNFNNTV